MIKSTSGMDTAIRSGSEAMVDIRFVEIEKQKRVVFILNRRGEKPLLVHGHVVRVDPKSVVVQDSSGDYHWLRHSKRAYDDGRMINVAVILARSKAKGELLDCTGHPITVGDEVAFMEAPSQGFSTSLVLGEVLRTNSEEVTLKVYSPTITKYMRKPDEVAVIGHLPYQKD